LGSVWWRGKHILFQPFWPRIPSISQNKARRPPACDKFSECGFGPGGWTSADRWILGRSAIMLPKKGRKHSKSWLAPWGMSMCSSVISLRCLDIEFRANVSIRRDITIRSIIRPNCNIIVNDIRCQIDSVTWFSLTENARRLVRVASAAPSKWNLCKFYIVLIKIAS
jgi:hypothetical protein